MQLLTGMLLKSLTVHLCVHLSRLISSKPMMQPLNKNVVKKRRLFEMSPRFYFFCKELLGPNHFVHCVFKKFCSANTKKSALLLMTFIMMMMPLGSERAIFSRIFPLIFEVKLEPASFVIIASFQSSINLLWAYKNQGGGVF